MPCPGAGPRRSCRRGTCPARTVRGVRADTVTATAPSWSTWNCSTARRRNGLLDRPAPQRTPGREAEPARRRGAARLREQRRHQRRSVWSLIGFFAHRRAAGGLRAPFAAEIQVRPWPAAVHHHADEPAPRTRNCRHIADQPSPLPTKVSTPSAPTTISSTARVNDRVNNHAPTPPARKPQKRDRRRASPARVAHPVPHRASRASTPKKRSDQAILRIQGR